MPRRNRLDLSNNRSASFAAYRGCGPIHDSLIDKDIPFGNGGRSLAMNVEHARGIPSLRSVVPRGDPEPSFVNPDSGAYHIDKNEKGQYFTCADSVKHTPIKYRASLASTMPLGGLPGCGSHSNPIAMTYLNAERTACYADTPLMNRILDKRYKVKGQDIMDSTHFSYVNCFSTAVDRDDPVKNKSFHLGPGCYKADQVKDRLAKKYRVIKFEVADKGPDLMVNPNVGDLQYDTAKFFEHELENRPCIKFNDVPRHTDLGPRGWGSHCLTSNVGPWSDIEVWQKNISIHHRGVPNRAKMPREGPGGDGSGYNERPPCIKHTKKTSINVSNSRAKSRDSKGLETPSVSQSPRVPPSSRVQSSPVMKKETLTSLGIRTNDLRAVEDWKRERKRRNSPPKATKKEWEVPVPAISNYKPKNLSG